jgi:hypothetical protein
MAKMTRRAMLYATSASVAAVAGVTALAGKQLHNASAAAPANTEVSMSGSVTAYIADARSGKISLLFGEKEIIITNPALAQQIVSLAK